MPSAPSAAWCSSSDSVFVCESMSEDFFSAPAYFATMLTHPFGPTTSFTKNAVSLIIGPQPASYQPDRPVGEGDLQLPVVVHPVRDVARRASRRSR